MKKLILVWFLSLGVTLAVSAKPALLVDIYNKFIERFADGNPAWKKDISLGARPEETPKAPYRLHYDDTLGYYSYRPKTWEDLSDYERFAVQNDPRMPHFVREMTSQGEPKVTAEVTTIPKAEAPALTLAKVTPPTATAAPVAAQKPSEASSPRNMPAPIATAQPLTKPNSPDPRANAAVPIVAQPTTGSSSPGPLPGSAPLVSTQPVPGASETVKAATTTGPTERETQAAMERLFGNAAGKSGVGNGREIQVQEDAPESSNTSKATAFNSPKGVLVRDGDESYAYRFDPQELINPTAVRLIEAR